MVDSQCIESQRGERGVAASKAAYTPFSSSRLLRFWISRIVFMVLVVSQPDDDAGSQDDMKAIFKVAIR